MLPAAAALFILGLILLVWVMLNRRSSGLPGGKVIYTDTRGWGKPEKPLYDPDLGLAGKPDYLVEQGGKIIPVEVKTRRAGDSAPYDSHIYQLAAYCLLVQRVLGKRPPYGILRYADKTFQIDYTQELETGVIELLLEMRRYDRTQPDRSHDLPARCRKCGYRSACDQAL
jgi:CRISPR-associated exonuclease Cas4